MARILLTVAMLLTLTGCPPKPPARDITAEQLAQRTAELEEARNSKSFWQTTALVLATIVILALVSGAMLGSKAKNDADGK